MKLFSTLYDAILRWARHRHAPYYLASLSVMEASFFPIPPDVMLVPMALAKPKRAWFYAGLTTFSSTFGGILGYLIGMFFLSIIFPYLQRFGYEHAYLLAKHWFVVWGFVALVIAAFTPVPYKIFTIAAGAMSMPVIPFILASLIGRGARFYLVSALMVFGGVRIQDTIRRYVDWIGWIVLLLLIIGYVCYRYISL